MKSFILCLSLLTLSTLHAASSSTSQEISQSEKTLSATSAQKKTANRHLGKIAKDIKKAQKDIVYIEKKIDKLEQSKRTTEKKYSILKEELLVFDTDLNQTTQILESKRLQFTSLLSEQFSVLFAMTQAHEPTEASVVLYEVYDTYKKHNNESLVFLRGDIKVLKVSKQAKLKLRNTAQDEIASIVKKRAVFAQKKASKVKLLKSLSSHENKYNTKLEKIIDKQNALRTTLTKLNILHKKRSRSRTQ
ncbi:MAG: hypothetical protein Q9M36_12655 [Sulfurovum sp.]|nr:hypothetical protein [Sulfurovum sp.]